MSPLGALDPQLEQALLDALPDPCLALDRHGHITAINLRGAQATGQPREALPGLPVQQTHGQLLGEAWSAARQAAQDSGTQQSYETFCAARGVWNHVTLTPGPHGLIVVLHDITEQKHTRHLQQLTSALGSTSAAGRVMDVMLAEAANATGASMAALYHPGGDGQHLELSGHLNYPPELQARLRRIPLSPATPISDAAVQLAPVYAHGEFDEPGSLAALPLILEGRLQAVLAVSYREMREFSAAERDFLLSLTQQGAQALARTRLLAEERQARLDAQQSEERFRSLITATANIVWTRSADGRFVEDQPLWRAFTGQPTEEILGHGWFDAVHPDDREPAREAWQRVVNGQGRPEVEYRMRRHDGEYRFMRARAVAISGPDGSVHEWVGVHEDITEHHEAERALRDSEQRFRSAFDQAAVGIAHVGLDGRWQLVNQRLSDIIGYTQDELRELTFRDITHPDHLQADVANVQRLLRGELDTYATHKRYVRQDGRPVWVQLTLALVRERDATPRYFVAVIEDIEHVKQAEQALRQAHEELEARVEQRTNELHALSEQLQAQVRVLEEHNRETRILGEMSEMLQACLSIDEAQQVVADHARRLFVDVAGALYSFGPSRNVLEETISWNGPVGSAPVFTPHDCWALRRGRPFVTNAGHAGVACRHTDHADGATLCVPLLAQGETVGMLHLAAAPGVPFREHEQRLAQTIAESVALAFVNLRLRDTLRQQSIRDSLTGLFNRRYLEETFEREARRAQRHGIPMGVVMLDVDHFKQFNDTHGHDAGDTLLMELGQVLRGSVRGEDVVTRLGGEEFVLLLPGATLRQTLERAEAVRRAVEVMQVRHHGRMLGKVTVSMGATAFPDFGLSLADLLRQADFALYKAKDQGRNRVVSTE